MKITVLTLLAGSAYSFSPAANSVRSSALNAEKSQAMPFLNKPALVSLYLSSDDTYHCR
jgi:light-harvesting complex I chlorophyll a/b binding protein 1